MYEHRRKDRFRRPFCPSPDKFDSKYSSKLVWSFRGIYRLWLTRAEFMFEGQVLATKHPTARICMVLSPQHWLKRLLCPSVLTGRCRRLVRGELAVDQHENTATAILSLRCQLLFHASDAAKLRAQHNPSQCGTDAVVVLFQR
jgi:hypothetical protein